MGKHNDILATMGRLARAEERFLNNEFLAPVVRGRGVRVKIAGVVCDMSVEPADFAGFGVFLPITHKQAMLDRPATLSQRRAYLTLFPRVQMIVCHSQDDVTLATPANRSDSRFAIEGAVEISLAKDLAMFDSIIARFDGTRFWFDQPDPRADPAIAAHLRQALVQMLSPKLIDRPGMTVVHRALYQHLHRAQMEHRERQRRLEPQRRMREALAHGGATLRDFAEHGAAYRVTYDLDGSRHVSIVRKNDLTVLSAGICLSGMDRRFDLTSMVGVLREARDRSRW